MPTHSETVHFWLATPCLAKRGVPPDTITVLQSY